MQGRPRGRQNKYSRSNIWRGMQNHVLGEARIICTPIAIVFVVTSTILFSRALTSPFSLASLDASSTSPGCRAVTSKAHWTDCLWSHRARLITLNTTSKGHFLSRLSQHLSILDFENAFALRNISTFRCLPVFCTKFELVPRFGLGSRALAALSAPLQTLSGPLRNSIHCLADRERVAVCVT